MGDSDELTTATAIDTPTAIELDGKLIAQEHRLFRIIRNWWSRKQFPQGDPRREACTDALIWRIVFALAPSLALTGAGLGGLFGLWIAYQSNKILRQQTEIIAEDAQASLRMRLIETLYQHDEPREPQQLEREYPLPSADLGISVYSHRARAEALNAFVDLERRRLRNSANPRVDLSYALLDHVDASGFDLRGVDLHAANMIASHLVDADLSEARLTSVQLGGALLTDANLSNADLTGADLTGAVLANANLSGADLTRAILVDTILEGSNLAKTKLTDGLILHSGMSQGDASGTIGLIKKHGWKIEKREIEGGVSVMVVVEE